MIPAAAEGSDRLRQEMAVGEEAYLLDRYTKYYELDIRERLRRFADPNSADQ
jgi:hypothetical protein